MRRLISFNGVFSVVSRSIATFSCDVANDYGMMPPSGRPGKTPPTDAGFSHQNYAGTCEAMRGDLATPKRRLQAGMPAYLGGAEVASARTVSSSNGAICSLPDSRVHRLVGSETLIAPSGFPKASRTATPILMSPR